MAREGADVHLAVLLADVVEVLKIVDVDEVLWRREPELHHRQETVTAGDQPGLGPEPLQQRERVVDGGRALIFERSRYLHCKSSSCCRARLGCHCRIVRSSTN